MKKMFVFLFVFMLLFGLEKEESSWLSVYNIDTTKMERYERKVLFEVKVGKGPGELGMIREGDGDGPMGIAVDSAGYIYIFDNVNNRILKYSPEGICEKEIRINEKIDLGVKDIHNFLILAQDNKFYLIGYDYFWNGIANYLIDVNGNIISKNIPVPDNISHRPLPFNVPYRNLIVDTTSRTIQLYNPIKKMNYKIKVPIENKEKNWECYFPTSLFLGTDRDGNFYIKVDYYEELSDNASRLEFNEYVKRLLKLYQEEIILKYNIDGKLVSVIKERYDGIKHTIWDIAEDGSIFLLEYSFSPFTGVVYIIKFEKGGRK